MLYMLLTALLFVSASLWARGSERVHAASPIKVAAVGDSITAGAGVSNPSTQSYPARLQTLLGAGYEVRNYGVSGTTMLKYGDSPYWNTQAYSDSSNWNPDIVVIQLGTNDTKSWNWQAHGSEFVADTKALIDHYRQLPSHPTVYLNLSPYVYGANAYGIDSAVMQNQVVPKQLQAASEMSPAVPVIHVNEATQNMQLYFPDAVHPNERGAAVIAETVRQSIGPAQPIPAGMLDRSGWTATASASNGIENPGKALDDLLSTRWSSGTAQTSGMWFVVDMKGQKTFNQVVLDNADLSAGDYPIQYQLYLSNDGSNWGTAVASGAGAQTATTINLAQSTARYIKVTQIGSGPAWWSIQDFRVLLSNGSTQPPVSTAIWFQNFEAGTGFSAGTGATVASDPSSANTGGAKSVKLTVSASGEPGTASNSVKITPQTGGSVDATGQSLLNFFIKDTQGANTIRVTIVDSANATWNGWTTSSSVQNQWTKISLPLGSVTGINKAAIKEIRIGEWNSGVYYVDDLYFAGAASDPVPAFSQQPPVSTAIWFQNFEAGTGFSAGTGATVASDPSSANTGGAKSVKLTVSASGDPGTTSNSVKITPQAGGSVDATGQSLLNFFIKDTQGSNTIRVTIVDSANATWNGWTTSSSVQNQWTKISLPLGSVTGINKAAIKEIRIGEWNTGVYYVDDLYFASSTTDPIPSF
ncbi:GDSL-type esterase/lipase family protein [Cohnella endophytica]|nr:GDSL-type esterase/lipase family protein [Cohnella endophytica]